MSHRKTDLGIPCRSKSAKVVLEASHQIRWVNAGCADAPGFLPLAVAERDYSSSTFVRVNWAKRTITVEVKTLDQVVADQPVPELVKIDAEGYDSQGG
jgi:FkbM family methyltransferase